MFKYLNKRRQKGQSTLEYAILIVIIIGALLSIQVYIKRGIQGRLKSAADDIGTQFSVGNTNVRKTVRTESYSSETFEKGKTRSELLSEDLTDEDMSSNIMTPNYEYWGG